MVCVGNMHSTTHYRHTSICINPEMIYIVHQFLSVLKEIKQKCWRKSVTTNCHARLKLEHKWEVFSSHYVTTVTLKYSLPIVTIIYPPSMPVCCGNFVIFLRRISEKVTHMFVIVWYNFKLKKWFHRKWSDGYHKSVYKTRL